MRFNQLKIRRSGFIFFLLIIFSAGSGAQDSADSRGETVLRWMGHWKGEGAREDFVQDVLGEFRFLHPEIDIKFAFAEDILPRKSQPAAAGYIVDMLRSGKPTWDVIWLDPLIYSAVAIELDDPDWGRKYLVDFNDVPGFPETQKDFLVEKSEVHRYTGGILPGPYLEGFLHAAWFNKELAEKIGIRIREEGMSDADLIAYVKAVQEYNRTAEKPVVAFLDLSESGSMGRLFYGFMASALLAREGDRFSDVDYVRAESIFNELGPCRSLCGESFLNWKDAARFMLQEDRALFFFDATWRYNAFQQVCPDSLGKLGLAQMPAVGGRTVKVGGYMSTWAVLKDAPGREAGIKLLQFLSRPVVAQKWVRDTKCPTGLRGDFYNSMYGDDEYADYQRKLHASCKRLFLDPYVFQDVSEERGWPFYFQRVESVLKGLEE